MGTRLEKYRNELAKARQKRAEIDEKIKELEENFFFYTWCPYDEIRSVIRLVTNWNTKDEEFDAILAAL